MRYAIGDLYLSRRPLTHRRSTPAASPRQKGGAVCQARKSIRASEQSDFVLCRLAFSHVDDDSFNLDEAGLRPSLAKAWTNDA